MPVALDGQQAVALHPGHGLADRRPALVQPLGDARAQRDDALLHELVDGPEVHLGGVDQVGSRRSFCPTGGSGTPGVFTPVLGRVRAVSVDDPSWSCGSAADLRLARQPGPARAPRRATACCRCSCSTRALWRPAGRRPAGLPAPRRCATSTPSLRSGGGSSSSAGTPYAEVVAAPPARSARSRVHVAADFGPYGAPARRAVERRSPGDDVELVRTGSPYAVAPGRVTQRATARPYQVFTPFSRALAGARLARRRCDPDASATALALDGAIDIPTSPRCPTGSSCPTAGEAAARAAVAAFRRRAPERPTTTSATAPTSTPPRGCRVHLKWGEIHPRTMLADLASAPATTTFRKELGVAGVLRRRAVPRARRRARDYYRPEFARDGLRRAAATRVRRLARGPHRLPDRRRRDAPAARRGLDAQPGPDDRRVASWSRTCTSSGSTARGTSCSSSSTATSPPTSTAGSGRPGCGTDAAPYFRVFNPIDPGREVRPGRRLRAALGPGARGVDGSRPRAVGARRAADGYPRIVDHAAERREALARYDEVRTQ